MFHSRTIVSGRDVGKELRRRKKDGKKKKVYSHNRETVQSGVGRTDSFIKNFAMNMSYQQTSLESAASSCWLSSSASWGCQAVLEAELPI